MKKKLVMVFSVVSLAFGLAVHAQAANEATGDVQDTSAVSADQQAGGGDTPADDVKDVDKEDAEDHEDHEGAPAYDEEGD